MDVAEEAVAQAIRASLTAVSGWDLRRCQPNWNQIPIAGFILEAVSKVAVRTLQQRKPLTAYQC
jgi:hypothetical protein